MTRVQIFVRSALALSIGVCLAAPAYAEDAPMKEPMMHKDKMSHKMHSEKMMHHPMHKDHMMAEPMTK